MENEKTSRYKIWKSQNVSTAAQLQRAQAYFKMSAALSFNGLFMSAFWVLSRMHRQWWRAPTWPNNNNNMMEKVVFVLCCWVFKYTLPGGGVSGCPIVLLLQSTDGLIAATAFDTANSRRQRNDS